MMWKDLARLEATCEVMIRSYLDQDKRLGWRMTITPRPPQGPDRPLIVTEAADIRDAVRTGIEDARKLGLFLEDGAAMAQTDRGSLP